MSYLIRHLVAVLSSPLTITLLLLLIAIVVRWRGHRRTAVGIAVGASIWLYLCSLGPVTQALLRPIEVPYRGIDAAHLPQGIAGIAVLGSYYGPYDGVPITGALSAEGLARVAEGVRLAKHYGNVRLVLSGGVADGHGFTPSARGYEIFAREMGIDPALIVVLDHSSNTADEARNLTKLFGTSPFLLVTSYFHMKRAMKLFEHTGAHPIPAPTGARIGPGTDVLFGPLLPRTENLRGTEAAFHEYLGLLAISAGLG
jgi:uncharacterized SAM-binding protein YcdF (DUF218 family)